MPPRDRKGTELFSLQGHHFCSCPRRTNFAGVATTCSNIVAPSKPPCWAPSRGTGFSDLSGTLWFAYSKYCCKSLLPAMLTPSNLEHLPGCFTSEVHHNRRYLTTDHVLQPLQNFTTISQELIPTTSGVRSPARMDCTSQPLRGVRTCLAELNTSCAHSFCWSMPSNSSDSRLSSLSCSCCSSCSGAPSRARVRPPPGPSRTRRLVVALLLFTLAVKLVRKLLLLELTAHLDVVVLPQLFFARRVVHTHFPAFTAAVAVRPCAWPDRLAHRKSS
mmetsp:Transcript_14307/g.50236  ORF Transcript_14307/g.50236 Transcript_14307/m.50236 type:complete len:274 (-) Transcript_14307:269-1090(-)